MKTTIPKKLTASQIKYLLAINELNKDENGVRCKDIADALGFSKPSVHKMISALGDIGLLSKPRYGTVSITEKGLKLLLPYSIHFYTVHNFLKRVLNLPENEAQEGTYALFAEVSAENINAMCMEMNHFADS